MCHAVAIRSFADTATAAVFLGLAVRRWPTALQDAMRAKLAMLDAAARLDDMRAPPGNRLEALKGDRRGQFSIRVNRQWRVCFRWAAGEPHDVEIVDYH